MSNFEIADGSELAKQQDYADSLTNNGFDFGLTVGSAFVESMRNTRYTTESAFDEILDNSIEAGATEIHVSFGYKTSDKKPESIAIIDNGHGMPKNMLRLAVLWGGTHREGARRGFGRFGFGLPSASVSQARRYSVFSKIKDQPWHKITIDLDDIKAGKYNNNQGRIVAPEVETAEPPKWILDYISSGSLKDNIRSGTIVILEKLDRAPKTSSTLKKILSEHFGIIYRNFIPDTKILVDGEVVGPTDPLFITPGQRFFTIEGDPQQATPLEPAEFEVQPKDGGPKVRVRVRYSLFPRGFLAIDKTKDAGPQNQNPRWSIKLNTMGIVVNRMGRQIEVLSRTNWPGLERLTLNNDRLWAAEIDFPAELDEEFGVSNDKQGAWPTARMWDLLKQAGVEAAIRNLRKAINSYQAEKNTEAPGSQPRSSEQTMAEAQKFRRKKVDADPEERERLAKDALERFVKRKAEETKRSVSEVRKEVQEEAVKHPYRVEFERMPGAPFFRVEQVGGMKILFLNRSHRFHDDLYAKSADRHFQSALEVLLFSIGECELDSQGNPDRAAFYASERNAWSQLLDSALSLLKRYELDTEVVDTEA